MDSPSPKNLKQASIIVYSKDYCPFCTAAKNLLIQRGMDFEEIDITHNADLQAEMYSRSAPRRTVPQIFIGEKGIGGFDDLKSLDQNGDLEAMVFPGGR